MSMATYMLLALEGDTSIEYLDQGDHGARAVLRPG